MNYWTQLSIDLANQRNYLDLLFSVYPTIPEDCRDINEEKWQLVEQAFIDKDNEKLITSLLNMELFPLKDSYVAYLKRDKSSICRNPQTINRLCGRLYSMGLSKLQERCSEPKETNRQIGPLFRRWVDGKNLGILPVELDMFLSSNENAILKASESETTNFAKERLGYTREKGIDFLARFNGKYIIGEAKFLTDFGGHQNAQFEDAISTINADVNAIKIAILDGVLYIPSNNKMFRSLQENTNRIILSSLVLRDFLYQV